MIFRIGNVSAIYFDVIALSAWQLKIVMSSFIPPPTKRIKTYEQVILSRTYIERGNICHIINLYIIHT